MSRVVDLESIARHEEIMLKTYPIMLLFNACKPN